MEKKLGRPTSNSKVNNYRIRLSDKELQMLEMCCKGTGLSKADVFRLGLEMVFDSLERK